MAEVAPAHSRGNAAVIVGVLIVEADEALLGGMNRAVELGAD
jgi:hypothetical protein